MPMAGPYVLDPGGACVCEGVREVYLVYPIGTYMIRAAGIFVPILFMYTKFSEMYEFATYKCIFQVLCVEKYFSHNNAP